MISKEPIHIHTEWVKMRSSMTSKCVVAEHNTTFFSPKNVFSWGCAQIWKIWSMAAIRPENQRTHSHRQRINQLVVMACPYSLQRSARVQGSTHYSMLPGSLRAGPVLMHFLLFSPPHSTLHPLPAFQLTLVFGDLICLSIQINLRLVRCSGIINIS